MATGLTMNVVKRAAKAGMAGVAALMLLAACNGEGDADYAQSAAPDVVVSGARKAAMMDEAAPAPEPGPGQDVANAGVLLAYSYSMGVSAPKTTIEPMMTAHQQKCAAAGPSVCQVLGSSVNSWGEDQVSAYLNLRAEPEWLEKFRTEIVSDAEGAGGRLTSNTVSAEDLTQFIVDMDARLEAKKTLRDRIRNLLETSDGSLSDVLAAERALADVQGEIDSMTAQLAAARARVAMSSLNISYQSDPETSVGLFKPLAEAFGDFGRTSVASVAEAVRFVARSWPFFIVLLIVLAILRVWWRGRRKA
ncbi:MAG: DUF4349 domain-containing protein [Parvularculaceae bacterium]|nr:DUF4349 domain-containing protein [Parvularculaceae bacterium]